MCRPGESGDDRRAPIRHRFQEARPFREGPLDENIEWGNNQVANRFHDDRSPIFRATPAKTLLDPFCDPINLETTVPDNAIYANYYLWFGWRFFHGGNVSAGGTQLSSRGDHERGMYRLGDRFTYNTLSFNVLISDGDRLTPDFQDGGHPDRPGYMIKFPAIQDAVNPWPGWNLHGAYATLSYWTSQNTGHRRGEVDLNYGFDDASVLRLDLVKIGDDRLESVQVSSTNPNVTPGANCIQIPGQ
jgi:hypothetical protein